MLGVAVGPEGLAAVPSLLVELDGFQGFEFSDGAGAETGDLGDVLQGVASRSVAVSVSLSGCSRLCSEVVDQLVEALEGV